MQLIHDDVFESLNKAAVHGSFMLSAKVGIAAEYWCKFFASQSVDSSHSKVLKESYKLLIDTLLVHQY